MSTDQFTVAVASYAAQLSSSTSTQFSDLLRSQQWYRDLQAQAAKAGKPDAPKSELETIFAEIDAAAGKKDVSASASDIEREIDQAAAAGMYRRSAK